MKRIKYPYPYPKWLKDIKNFEIIENYREYAGMPHPDVPRYEDLFIPVEKHADFIGEEAQELKHDYAQAKGAEKMVEAADALCDALVFVYHAVCDMGLSHLFPTLFAEVDRSNRTKGHEGKFFDPETHKLIKGPNFEPPNLQQFFNGEAVVIVRPLTSIVRISDQYETFICYISELISNLVPNYSDVLFNPCEDGVEEFYIENGGFDLIGKLILEGGIHVIDGVDVNVEIRTRETRTIISPRHPICRLYDMERGWLTSVPDLAEARKAMEKIGIIKIQDSTKERECRE